MPDANALRPRRPPGTPGASVRRGVLLPIARGHVAREALRTMREEGCLPLPVARGHETLEALYPKRDAALHAPAGRARPCTRESAANMQDRSVLRDRLLRAHAARAGGGAAC